MNGSTICVIGDMQIRPNMNLDHIEHIGRYIADKKPDVIVQIGDWWDMPSLSSYDRGKASFEGRRVKEDIEAGHEGMRRLLEPIKKLQQAQRYFKKRIYSPRMIMTLGNHDERLDRAAQSSPELQGYIGTKELHIEQYGWEVYEFLKPINVAGINFVHYLANPMTGRPYSGSAAGMLKTVGASFVMGHKQVLDIAIRTTLEGKNQIGIINGACLTSDHKVLHSDLIYRRLGDLKAGDKLVSFDEFSGVDGKRGRRYKTGTVEKVRLAQEEVFLVKLKSGKTFKATKDHRWLVKTGSFYYWKYTHELRKGTRIPKLLEEWEQDFSYNAGWLSGIYDGEGCFYTRKTSTGNHIGQLGVTQKPGLVCNKIKEILNDLVGVGTLTHHIDKSGCDNLRIKGGLKNIAKVLGVLQPIRLMNKFKPELMGRITTKDSDLDTVVSIEAIGVQEIVQVKVDESTMVVEGYGHHNCYPHFEDYKGHQGGNSHFRGITMLYEAKDGFALPSFISLDFLRERYSQTS